MRPVLLSSSLTAGGSAKAAVRLFRALRELGVDAHLLAPQRATGERGVVGMFTAAERVAATLVKGSEIALRSLYSRRKDVPFSSAWFGCRIEHRLKELGASVVHFQQAHNGFLSVRAFSAPRWPSVWTVHDWWPLTGGCHFPGVCDRHRIGCGRCPALGSERVQDLSRHNYRLKRRHFRRSGTVVTTVSRSLAEMLVDSPLFSGKAVTVIPNGLDTRLFRPLPKQAAREILEIPPAATVLLFGAKRGDANKGFAAVRALAESLASTAPSLMLVTFGDSTPIDSERLPIPAKSFGLVDDDHKLALLYSAADVTLVPSWQESFGLVAAESMSCGTPAVGYRTSGLIDILDHRVNGFLAEPESVPDYIAGVRWMLEQRTQPPQWDALAKAARAKVVDTFDARLVARRFMAIYAGLDGT